MIKKALLTTVIFSLTVLALFAQKEDDVIRYIDKYKSLAIEEQIRTGVPAAITLAQGIHESSAGGSELATLANNHFGIKCKSNWEGETMLHDDDRKQECFRKYTSAQQSYIDHSDFLKAGSRYRFLFEIEITDYVGWATGLKKAGYATNPAYVKKLTDLVEKYDLQKYTYEGLSKSKIAGEVVPEKDKKNPDIIDDPNNNYKGLKGFWASKGENINEKAILNNLKPGRILELNDLADATLATDMFIFLEKKRKIGTVEFHNVKEGETMHLISQMEAMHLQNLYSFNNMKPGEEPETGEQLTLQYRSYGTPRIKGKVPEPIIPETVGVNTEESPKSDVADSAAVSAATLNAPEPIASISGILDPAKAQKTEALLGNPGSAELPTETAPVKEMEAPAPTKKTKAVAPKRTYNESHVDDSVKELKEKFDGLVYRPMPERKKPEPVKPNSPAPSPLQKNDSKSSKTPASSATKADSSRLKSTTGRDGKTSPVEKTQTGLVRDVKKLEEEKKKAKEEQAKLEAAKSKTTDAKKNSKATDKKGATPEKATTKSGKTVADKKGVSAKKEEKKSESVLSSNKKAVPKNAAKKEAPKKEAKAKSTTVKKKAGEK